MSALLTDSTECSDTCGTVNYMSPELIQNKSYDVFKADIWSLGVILYEGIVGARPFDDKEIAPILKKITSYELSIPGTISSPLKSAFLKRLVGIHVALQS